MRKDLGLDKPLPQQFAHFFVNALRGDFGISMVSKTPGERRDRLALYADLLADRHQHAAGRWRSARDRRGVGGMAQPLAGSPRHDAGGVGDPFPAFALGMLLMQVFSVELGWLPTVGADSWRHYILPSITSGRRWRR